MSALAGVVFFGDEAAPIGMIEKMTAAMRHRGPDGIRHRQLGGAAFGFCMLHTTPESEQECQPLLLDEGRGMLVFAGRVDNRARLRKDLQAMSVTLRDDSDAELVLRAWECWGEECPNRLVGDFVFFVWCSRKRQIFAARDVAGVRHCYYSAGNGWFAFSSELRPMFATGLIERKLNKDFFFDYIGDQFDRIDGSISWFEGINRLPHAHAMRVSAEGMKIWRYWEVEKMSPQRLGSIEEYREGFAHVLTEAIECRLRSNGPVGVMLSGGIDSSAITGLICKKLQHRLSQPLQSYSLVRADRKNCLDWPHIQAMLADNPGIDATVIDSDLSSAHCLQLIEQISHLDAPQSLAEALPHIILAEAAQRRGCRVLIDGFAADMLFMLPDTSLDYAFKYGRWASVPAIMRSAFTHRIAGIGGNLLRVAAREFLPSFIANPARRYNQRRTHHKNLASTLLNHALLRKSLALDYVDRRTTLREHLDAPLLAARPHSPELQSLIRSVLAYGYEINETLFGQHSVELRGPFSDRRVLEFAFGMPLEAKFSLGWTKRFLRESVAGNVPDSVRYRTVIAGHPGWKFCQSLIQHWMEAAPQSWFSPRNDGYLQEWLDREALERMFDDAGNPGGYESALRVLKLAVLCRWLHTFENRRR